MPSHQDYLDKYAEVIINVAVNLQPKQRLQIGAMWGLKTGVPITLAPFVRLLTKHAYLAGASYVNVQWDDIQVTGIRLQHGSEEALIAFPEWRLKTMIEYFENGDAILGVTTPESAAIADLDPDRVAIASKSFVEHTLPMRDAGKHLVNGTVVNGVSKEWAGQVFPDLSIDDAVNKLWDTLFQVSRIKTDNPVALWETHVKDLGARAGFLQAKQYQTLHFQAPNTDLRVGLVDNHTWITPVKTVNGITSVRNFPTEEVFTMPHHDRVEGVVTTTKPFIVSGLGTVQDMTLTFENGKVIKAIAKTGQSILDKLLDTDDGARHLGEVALVPHSSLISQANITFYSTLFDENSSCHMALGNAYSRSLQGGDDMSPEELAKAGANKSMRHEDFMVGSDALQVDGILPDGTIEAVLRDGEWAFDV